MVCCHGRCWMKNRLLIYIGSSFFLGSAIFICDRLGVLLPRWVRFYVNDFLIIPIVLFVGLKVVQWTRNDLQFKLNLFHILWICALYSLLFEVVLPPMLLRYTSDWVDVILYFASGLVFYGLQQTDKKKEL